MPNAIIKRIEALEKERGKRRIVWACIRDADGGYEIRVDTWDGVPESGRTPQSEAPDYKEIHETYEAGIARINEIAAKYPASGDFTLLDLTYRRREEAAHNEQWHG